MKDEVAQNGGAGSFALMSVFTCFSCSSNVPPTGLALLKVVRRPAYRSQLFFDVLGYGWAILHNSDLLVGMISLRRNSIRSGD